VTEGGRGVVVSLATRPALPVRVAALGCSLQAAAGNGVGQGVLSGGRVGAGDPEAVGMVAVAALLGDQLGEAAVMVG
jgi:hypothetical protein